MPKDRIYESLSDVLSDPLFPEVDCRLRTGAHIGPEEITAHSFLQNTSFLLAPFYRRYDCQLVHDALEESDYFFLSSFGKLLKGRVLADGEMLVGMTLAYLLTDPEFIRKKVPFQRLLSTMRHLLGEEVYFQKLVNRQRGKNSEKDEEKAEQAVRSALNTLRSLGFLSWPRGGYEITVKSPIFRFITPARGEGDLEKNVKILMSRGLVEIDEEPDAGDEEGYDDENE